MDRLFRGITDLDSLSYRAVTPVCLGTNIRRHQEEEALERQ
jgi:hypothetical protein